MIETQETEIGSYRFRLSQLPAGKGRRLLVRLTKVLGPTIAAAVAELPDEGEGGANVLDMPVRSVSQAIFELCEKLTEADLDHVCEVMADRCEFSEDGEHWLKLSSKGQFDLVFAGAYLDMIKWIGWTLSVNYADFFGGSGALEKARQAFRAASATRNASQTASNGGSTGSPRPAATTTA